MYRIESMFINKFSKNKGIVYQSGQLLPILAANQLLGERRYRFFLEQCQSLSRLPEAHFQVHYVDLIYRFADYVQLLPREWNAPLGSLLNFSLERAMRCLAHFVEAYPGAPAVDRLAMFSAGLLRNLAYVMTQQKVYITDEKGYTQQEWQPLAGPMNADEVEGGYYRMISLSNHYQHVERPITLLMLRQVMPKKSFLWIAQFPKLFAEWIAAIEDDETDGGRFRKILQLYELPWDKNHKTQLPIHDIPEHDSVATEYGDQFLEWLRDAIAKGEISINSVDSNVFVTEEGIFLDKGIFKEFTELYDVPVNMFTVFEQFGNLFGLTKLSGLDYRIEQLFSPTDSASSRAKQNFLGQAIKQASKVREGVMLQEPGLVFDGPIPNESAYIRSSSENQANTQRLPKLSSLQVRPDNRPG